MNKQKIGAIIVGAGIALAAIGGIICTEKIPTGYVGVQYSMSGGVQDELLTQGWHIVAPNKKVNLYSLMNTLHMNTLFYLSFSVKTLFVFLLIH